MKRRALLHSLASLPTAVALPSEIFARQEEPKTAAREKGIPAGPPVVAPGTGETPATPIVAADTSADMLVRTFNAEQFSALAKFSELVAPSQEEIPGAREAEVAEFLDFLLGQSPEKSVRLYKGGLDQLNAESRRNYGKPFCEISSDQAKPILASLDQPWQYDDSARSFSGFLRVARGDVIKATLNSRSYIDVVSQLRRSRQASGLYWYPME